MTGARDVADSLQRLGDAAADAEETLRAARGEAIAQRPSQEPRRVGWRSFGFWTPLPAYQALRVQAILEDTTSECLMNEALNLLFRSRSLPEIAATATSDPAAVKDLGAA